MHRRIAVAVVFLAACVSGFVCPPAGAANPETALPVRVGVYQNPPKIQLDEAGRPAGFWVDLVDEIAARENWSVEYVSGTWNEGLDRLAAGEIDVMPDVAWTAERAERFPFSEAPVLMSWSRLYVHSDNNDFQSIRDLNGGSVAALRGSVNLEGPAGLREMIESFHLDVTIVEFESYHRVFKAIQSGNVDAGITNRNFGNLHAANYDVKKTPVLFQPINLMFAFRPDGDPALVEIVDSRMGEFLQSDDSAYFRLLADHFESGITEKRVEVLPPYAVRAIAAIGIVLTVLVLVVLVSRVQVKRQTRRIEAQRTQLATTDLQYREIFNSPDDVIFIHDSETGIVLDVNNAVRNVFGYDPKEVIGRDLNTLSAGEHPYTGDQAYELIRKAITHGPQISEWRARRASGEIFWAEVSLKYAEISGEGRVIAVVRDIEDRRRIAGELADERERLAVTLRSIGDVVITTDLDGKVTLLNKAAEAATGWLHDSAVGRHVTEIVGFCPDGEWPYADGIQGSTAVKGLREVILKPHGDSPRTVTESSAQIRDRESRIVGVVTVFRDVTDQIRMEEQVAKIRKLESVGVLAGGIAHDFNNLLAAVLGNLNMVQDITGPESEAAPLLEAADLAVQRAAKLTQQLLTFAQGGEPIKEAASIDRIVRESADFVLHGSGVACEFEAGEDLWLVEADPGQISQVVQNLVLNARDAMPDGGTVHIGCANCPSGFAAGPETGGGRDFVQITVRDEGSGIRSEVLDKVFDPFFTTKDEGSGLGLAVTHSIVTKHGGHISVESTPGGGTCFMLYLPRAGAPAEDPVETAPVVQGDLSARVLVLDDEEPLRALYQSMLRRLGHQAVLVEDGYRAVRLYEESDAEGRPFDLVVLDLTIPGGMGGAEAGEAILKRHPDARIVVASGYSNDPVMAHYREYGFRGALGKPMRMSDLERVIASVLGQVS